MEEIRNFSIIAHIDHGKSTLSDRLLEECGLKSKDNKNELVLDTMDLEKERGITIKSQSARMEYSSADGKTYILNLIDTPGHMDFNYEVSRSLSACEGAILLVDAAQGIQAQTLVNFHLAFDNNLPVIGVINKIDLPSANIKVVTEAMENTLLLEKEGIINVSAKTGEGVKELLEAVIKNIPPPKGDKEKPLKALIIDSYYDPYRGVIIKIRIFDGRLKAGDKILFFSNKNTYEVDEVGIYRLKHDKVDELSAGEVGYIIAGIKQIQDVHVGDTITLSAKPISEPLPGFKEVKPMVFAGIYPMDGDEYENLKKALEKLQLNDSSLSFMANNSPALGFGFRCGFLGLLHMEIVQERLEREFNINLVITAPNVKYRVRFQDKDAVEIDNPADFPENQKVEYIEEPMVKVIIITPKDYIGNIMTLMTDFRGKYIRTEYINPLKVELEYEVPFAEIIFDFLNTLKSVTRGYASFDYEFIGFQKAAMVKVDILVHKNKVDALSFIAHKDKAYIHGRAVTKKLKEVISRHMFEVSIQAAIGSKVIARESVKAVKKDVTAKCYGGDITRKRKLLEKQKAGKKRMKMIGNVEIPQEAFLSILKVNQ
ncbi:MAG: translation elongation factor 4 [Spirochaetes bacterium]|nr:translation elongation factor 4 [Spirochaetota bacterium]